MAKIIQDAKTGAKTTTLVLAVVLAAVLAAAKNRKQILLKLAKTC